MPEVTDIIVEVRRKDLSRAGQVKDVNLDLDATPRFNLPGEWTLRLSSTASADLLTAATAEGAGIIVTHVSGQVLFSGPWTTKTRDKYGIVTLTGTTDDRILWQQLAYADPANDAESRAVEKDTRTGAAETLMYGFVDDNIGPSAIASRELSTLTLGTDLARGGTTTKSGAHQPLGELLQEIAEVAGLGFRVVQVGSSLQFQVFAPTDVSDTVRLDILNGTLADQQAESRAPSLTRAIVAGQGEGVARTLVEVTTTESDAAETLWGESFRSERFIDQRQTDDSGELTAKGLEELLAGAPGDKITLLPSGDSTMVFPTDWFLGDIAAVVVDGAEIPATVTSATIVANAEYGLSYGVGIGEQPGQPLESRVSQLERNNSAGGGGGGVSADSGNLLELGTDDLPLLNPLAVVPIGGGIAWYSTSDPASPGGGIEFMVPDGRAISRSTYATLYALWGDQFGAGDGSTTFNIPDEAGKFTVGRDSGDVDFDSMGETGGGKSHSHGLSAGYALIRFLHGFIARSRQKVGVTGWTNTHSHGGSGGTFTASGLDDATELGGTTDSASSLPPYIVRNSAIRVK